jgi:hypothetical protein
VTDGNDCSRAPFANAVSGLPGDHRVLGENPTSIRVQLLHVPDCPLVDQVRAVLYNSLAKLGMQVTVEELEGPCPSPTLLISGRDVTGRKPVAEVCCRLDLPTEDQVIAALSLSSFAPRSAD